MKRRFLLWLCAAMALIVLLVCGIGLFAKKPTEDFPDWLDGTLLINVLGATELPEEDDQPTEQYIVSFDFSQQSIDSTPIPENALLLKYKDDTVLLYRENGLHNVPYDGCENGIGAYRTYGIKSVTEDGLDTIWEAYMFSVNPLVIYGITDDETFCYLGYGVSEEGELEYQLLCEKSPLPGSLSSELTVLRSYPLDDSIQYIHVSVSPDGKIAWRENINSSLEVYVFDGQSVYSLPDDEQYTYSICWLDDDRLLYIANITDFSDFHWGDPFECVLRIWHTNTNVIEDLNSTWTDNDVILSFPLRAITLNQDKTLLAGYRPPVEADLVTKGEIVIVNMETGESYVYEPWDQVLSFNSFCSIEYSQDDNGLYFFNPGEAIDVQMVWLG